MKYLKLAWFQFKSQWKLKMVAIIQITVAIVILNLFFSTLTRLLDIPILAHDLCTENMYTMRINAVANEDDSFDENAATEEEIKQHYEEYQKLQRQYAEAYEKETGIPADAAFYNDKSYSEEYDYYDFNVRWMGQNTWDDDVYDSYYGNSYNAEELAKKYPEVKGLYSTGWIFNRSKHDGSGEVNEIWIWDKKITDNLNMETAKGRWLSEKSADGVTEAVAFGTPYTLKNLKIGSMIPIEIFNFKTNEYENKEVKIVGILGSPTYSMNVSAMFFHEEDRNLSDLFGRASMDSNSKSTQFPIIINPFDGYDYTSYHATQNTAMFLEFNDNVSDERKSEIIGELEYEGFVLGSLKSDYEKSLDESLIEVRANMVMLIIMLLMSLFTMVGITALSATHNKKLYSVYTLCGSKLKDNVIITVIEALISIGISAVLCAGALYVWNYINIVQTHELFGLTFGKGNIIISILFYLIIGGVSLLIPVKMLRKNQPMQLWRGV